MSYKLQHTITRSAVNSICLLNKNQYICQQKKFHYFFELISIVNDSNNTIESIDMFEDDESTNSNCDMDQIISYATIDKIRRKHQTFMEFCMQFSYWASKVVSKVTNVCE